MNIKLPFTSENRVKVLAALGPLAGLAVTLSIILGRLEDQNLDFVSGFLVGVSIVWNLTFIVVVTRHLRKIGGSNDRQ